MSFSLLISAWDGAKPHVKIGVSVGGFPDVEGAVEGARSVLDREARLGRRCIVEIKDDAGDVVASVGRN